MPDPVWLFTITNAADQTGAAKTLHFSDGQYIDGSEIAWTVNDQITLSLFAGAERII